MTTLRTAALLLAALAPLAASAGEVVQREANQQRRIGQGAYSGQLTARETGRLETREAAINATRRTDLAANGGRLTPGEYAGLNRRENRLSNGIYADKHNLATQPGVLPR